MDKPAIEKPFLLHFATPAGRVSPFDVNMAYDAGWNAVIPYAGVNLEDMAGFTQDAIFSRGPKGAKRTGIFIGGRDALLADDMLHAAGNAMVPPFVVSVFADPSGAFTTAAAMLAKVEQALLKQHALPLSGRRVVIFGGTGPVGMVVAILASLAGAEVSIPGHDGLARAQIVVDRINTRFGMQIRACDGSDASELQRLLAQSEIVLATAKAGVEVLSAAHLAQASVLRVAADINAVPPAGIAGIGMMDEGVALAASSGHAVGIGPLAIGNLKYQVQQALLQAMLTAEKPLLLGFSEAFVEARRRVA